MSTASLQQEVYVVMGLARSGLSAAEFLLNLGARVRVTDEKTIKDVQESLRRLQQTAVSAPGNLELSLGGHPPSLLQNARAVILSPGIPATHPFIQAARAAEVPVWSEVELAYRHLSGKIIGVTGSNGKSTTTALIAHILKESGYRAFAAGNIGQALTGFLRQDSPEAVYVTELSSFQLETIHTFKPHIGLLLNITPDHLDRYAGMEQYAAAKWRLFENCGKEDFAVINGRDPGLIRRSEQLPCPACFFRSDTELTRSKDCGAYLSSNGEVVIQTPYGPTTLVRADELPLPGRHNLENVMAASLACYLYGAALEKIGRHVRSFRGLPHRLEAVGEIDHRKFYNDSKATNVDSTILALESFSRPVLLILGGKDKGGDFSLLKEPARRKVRHGLLLGEAAATIEAELSGEIPTEHCVDMNAAVRRAFELSEPGDIVLLSPACASFDMFDDFEHRGDIFRMEVNDLKEDLEQ